MTRILADLSDGDIKWLDARAAEQGASRGDILGVILRWYRRHIEGDK